MPAVNTDEGWRSKESGSHSRARVQDDAHRRGERRGHVSPATPPLKGDPQEIDHYLCHREAPWASSGRPAFCRGYWGRGAPCLDAVQSAGAHSGWAPGCLGFPAVCCPQAEGGRLAPGSKRAHRCCSHRTPLGRRALWMRQNRSLDYSVGPEPCSHLRRHLPSQVRSRKKDCGQHPAICEEQRSSMLKCFRLIS